MPLADLPPAGPARGLSRAQVLLLCIAYAALLAYLSFIPFIYRPLSFDEALRRFAELPYLALGAQSRADWVANLVMYLPLGWLLGRLLQPAPRGRIDAAVLACAVLIGGAWAVAVEFAQLYYPNRTASLNDVIAEVIGTAIGAALWSTIGQRWKIWWEAIVHGGERTARAALNGYVIAYLVLSLSPFDFVLSGDELADHLASPLVGLWMAGVSCGPVPCSARLLFEIALTAPLGLWFALHRRHVGLGQAVAAGLVFGVVLEAVQLLLVSGVSQGASVLSRGAGFVLGAAAYARRTELQAFDRQRYGRPVVLALLLPYLWAVGFVNGWWQGTWIDAATAWERFGQMRWLPFHFHYFTTEQNAIRSGILHTLLYMPVGLAAWLWSRRPAELPAVKPALLAAAIAVVAELGKLFVPPRHPDMTDVLIAAVAAGATAVLLRAISRPAQLISASTAASVAGEPARKSERAAATPIAWRLAGALALLVAFASLLDFPLLPALLAVALAVYAAALLRAPLLYLWVVPLALPLLDLAPWSGRFFWDEFDLLLLATFGARLLTLRPRPAPTRLDLPKGALVLLAFSVAASAAAALLPLAPLDANAFSTYLSPYNALRVAKGYLWAVLLLALIARDAADGAPVRQRLVQGLALALLGLAAVVIWERAVFTGLFGSGLVFRVAGSVSAMHVGGAYLDALLVALLPFALLLALRADTRLGQMLGAGALLLGLYAVVVTFSRSTVAATIVGGIVFALLASRHGASDGPTPGQRGIARRAAFAGVLIVVLAAAALGTSETLRQRLATVGADAGVRQAHWQDVLAMFSPTLPRLLFGMGLGAFPREFYLQHGAVGDVAAYRLQGGGEGGDARALILHGGRGLFVVQRIDRPAGSSVEIEVRGHLVRGEGRLAIGLCEATVLYSGHCHWATAPMQFEPGVQRLRLPSPPGQPAPAVLQRPIVLSLSNAAAGSVVAIEAVSVKNGAGIELLRNGDFGLGLDRWFFTSDRHLAWRAHNSVLQVAFEQGLCGLVAWTWIGLLCLRRSAVATPGSAAVAVAAACFAVLVVAQFDSLFDAPRLTLLILLLALFPLRPDGRAGAGRGSP